MKIGILGTADIALRRFLPALQKSNLFTFAGIASRNIEKTKTFIEQFGGQAYQGYDALLEDREIDAVYLPLPPALHYEWGKKALLAGKNVFMEKPFCANFVETEELLEIAEQRELAVHENYMFLYHRQLDKIKELLLDGSLGQIRLLRISFGFPKRGEHDFRYHKDLGGGAILDCGGYPVRLALELLGDTACMKQARLCRPENYEVDLFGCATLENKDGICAQISFGMDNAYQCQLEIWGSKATLIAPRIFTAPPNLGIKLMLVQGQQEQTISVKEDDHFLHSLEVFAAEVEETTLQKKQRMAILKQAQLIEEIQNSPQKS